MRYAVVICNIIFSLLGVLSLVPLLFSVMLFDAPGSTSNPYLWIMLAAIVLMPFTCAGSVIISREVIKHSHDYHKALIIALLPLLVILLGAIGALLLQMSCGGNFVC